MSRNMDLNKDNIHTMYERIKANPKFDQLRKTAEKMTGMFMGKRPEKVEEMQEEGDFDYHKLKDDIADIAGQFINPVGKKK